MFSKGNTAIDGLSGTVSADCATASGAGATAKTRTGRPAGALYYPAVMGTDNWIDELVTYGAQPRDCAFFVVTGETRIPRHVGGENSGQPARNTRLVQGRPPSNNILPHPCSRVAVGPFPPNAYVTKLWVREYLVKSEHCGSANHSPRPSWVKRTPSSVVLHPVSPSANIGRESSPLVRPGPCCSCHRRCGTWREPTITGERVMGYSARSLVDYDADTLRTPNRETLLPSAGAGGWCAPVERACKSERGPQSR
jgi:hypothetical protein